MASRFFSPRASLALLLISASALFPSHAWALWSQTVIASAPGSQGSPTAVTDGAGGAIVAWLDDRSGSQGVYVHHVLSSDSVDPSWPANGLLVNAAFDKPAIAPDGAGGVIVVWNKFANYDIYAQRVLASGALDPSWPAAGVLVCSAPDNQFGLKVVPDGSGGVLLTWMDQRNALTTERDIFAHHVLSSGVVDPAWPANGLGVCTAAGDQSSPVAVSDGSGGIIIAWDDFRNGSDYDPFAQRLLSSGAIAAGWPAGGKALSANNADQGAPRICPDGAGGAIVAWSDSRNGAYDVFAMRVTVSGGLAQGWQNGGEGVCEAAGDQEPFDIIADGVGGAIVSWYDFRSGATSDIYVQKTSASGNMSWTTNGLAVCTAANYQVSPSLASDGSGGAYVAWQDRRHETTNFETELYLHHVLSTGSPAPGWPSNGGRWTYDGALPFGGNFGQPIVADGSGGAIAVWNGAPTGAGDLYSLHINSTWFQRYEVNVSASPSGLGTVTKNPNLPIHNPGTSVTITATPNQGYLLDHWSGNASGAQNPLTIVVDSDKNVTAHFAAQPPACGNWTAILSATSPSPRGGAPAVWDPVRHRVLMFGGYDGTNYLNDLWQFTVAQGWSQILPDGLPPSPRYLAGLIYDPIRDRLLVVGGGNSGSPPPNDVWQLTLTGTPTWSQLAPAGSPPPAVVGFTTIYDPVRDRIVKFGGSHFTSVPNGDVWALSLAGTPTWGLVLAGPGGRRTLHTAIYDPVRDRMIIQGGTNPQPPGNFFSDASALNLAGSPSWTVLTGQTTDQTLWIDQSAAVYDPVRDRMILVAGSGGPASGADVGRVRSLSLEIQPLWSILQAGGLPLGPRRLHSAVYEPDLDLILTFNGIGFSSGVYLNDAKRLDCAGGWWLQTGGQNGTVTAYPTKTCYENNEAVTLQAVGSGSYGLEQWLGDASGTNPLVDVAMDGNKTVVAQFHTGSVGVEAESPLVFALGRVHPNPAPGNVTVEYSLARESRVSLRVFDLAGRQVAHLLDGVRPAGRHTIGWDGMAGGSRLGAGVYLVRFDTIDGNWARRFVLIR